MKIKRSENEVVNSVIEWLQWHKIFCWRTNNIPIFDPINKRYRAMPKYAMAGVSDIIGILPDGKGLFIECKRTSNRSGMSEAQKEFEGRVKTNKGIYILATCIEDVERELTDYLTKKR